MLLWREGVMQRARGRRLLRILAHLRLSGKIVVAVAANSAFDGGAAHDLRQVRRAVAIDERAVANLLLVRVGGDERSRLILERVARRNHRREVAHAVGAVAGRTSLLKPRASLRDSPRAPAAPATFGASRRASPLCNRAACGAAARRPSSPACQIRGANRRRRRPHQSLAA